MKRKIALIFILVILGGGLFYYQKVRVSNAGFPEHFLPEKVLLYLNQKDLGFIVEDLRKKPITQTISSIDFVKLALDVELSYNTVTSVRGFRDFITSAKAELLFNEFLSDEFTLALLPDDESPDLKSYIQHNLILFSHPKHKTLLPSLLFSLLGKDLNITSSQYGEHFIYRIAIDDINSIAMVFADNMYLITLDERLLRRALDRFDEKRVNLSEDYFFQELRKQNKNSQLFCFFSIDHLRRQCKALVKDKSGMVGELLSDLDRWVGFTSGSLSTIKKDAYTQNVMKIHFNENEINKHTAHFLSIKPDKEKIIYNVPDDTFLYYWSNTFDLSTMWDIYTIETGTDDIIVEDFKKTVEQMAGIRFNEILELPDSNVHLIIRKSSEVDLVPVPNFSIVFNLNSRAKTEQVIRRILTSNNIPHSKEKYRGVEYTYWGEGIQKGLQPVYAFHENNLYISSSVNMQTDVIDTIKDKNNITKEENFGRIAQSLLIKNNSSMYVQVDELIEVTKKLVSWGSTMVAIQNRKAAHKSKILLDGLIIPLLDGMKMYSNVATRSYTDNGVITIESKIISNPENSN